MVTERSFKVSLPCPFCKKKSTYTLKIPKAKLKTVKVECLKCGYKWTYRGRLERRVECPKCRSTRNEVNREIFGSWRK